MLQQNLLTNILQHLKNNTIQLIIMIFFAAKEKTEDLLYQAMSFMEKKQPKAAIPIFKKITKQDPKNIEALYNQGLALNQLKK